MAVTQSWAVVERRLRFAMDVFGVELPDGATTSPHALVKAAYRGGAITRDTATRCGACWCT